MRLHTPERYPLTPFSSYIPLLPSPFYSNFSFPRAFVVPQGFPYKYLTMFSPFKLLYNLSYIPF